MKKEKQNENSELIVDEINKEIEIAEEVIDEIELKKILKDTLEISRKNQKDIQYIKRFVIWSQIWGAFKVLMFVVPLILGIIYLPSFIDKWMETYQDILPQINLQEDTSGATDIRAIIGR